jgi:CRISPR-associated endoribonuclease Cas6
MKTSRVVNDCLWMAVDIRFDEKAIRGRDAPELWRAVIKDGLLASRSDRAMVLLEPLRVQGEATNVDCPGLVIECRDLGKGFSRVFFKFLGKAYTYAPACLLALEAGLRQGVGQERLSGTTSTIHVMNEGDWVVIPMPLIASELQRWRANPAVLAGYRASDSTSKRPMRLVLQTRSRWVWRQKGQWVRKAPLLSDVLHLVEQRLNRFERAWGGDVSSQGSESLQVAIESASQFRLANEDWGPVQRRVGGRYQSHGCQGRLSYEGPMSEELLYWLFVGSFLHIGQQTAIGLGGYELMVD